MGEHALAVLPLCLAIDASTARSPVLRLATSPPHLCDQSLLIPAFLCTSLASPGRDALAEGEVRPKPAPMFCSMRRLTLCDGKNTDARAKGMTEHLQTHVLKLTSEAIGLSAGIAVQATGFGQLCLKGRRLHRDRVETVFVRFAHLRPPLLLRNIPAYR